LSPESNHAVGRSIVGGNLCDEVGGGGGAGVTARVQMTRIVAGGIAGGDAKEGDIRAGGQRQE